MKKTIAMFVGVALAGGLSYAHAADAERGKKLFEDPKLGGGTTGNSCATCHEGGAGLSKDMFHRKSYSIMGMEKPSLEAVVNACIETPLGGHPIAPEGKDMQDLIAYMKVLTGAE